MIKNFWIALDELLNSRPDPTSTVPEIQVALKPVEIKLTDPVETYDRQAEIERIQALRREYMEISDAIDAELSDLKSEYDGPNTSEKRRAAINKRRLVLLNKRATNTSKLQALERKTEKIYNESR